VPPGTGSADEGGSCRRRCGGSGLHVRDAATGFAPRDRARQPDADASRRRGGGHALRAAAVTSPAARPTAAILGDGCACSTPTSLVGPPVVVGGRRACPTPSATACGTARTCCARRFRASATSLPQTGGRSMQAWVSAPGCGGSSRRQELTRKPSSARSTASDRRTTGRSGAQDRARSRAAKRQRRPTTSCRSSSARPTPHPEHAPRPRAGP